MENNSHQNEKPIEAKLDEMLEVLKRIEKQGEKHFWEKSGVKFLLLNFTKILASILMLFFLWKIWGIVSGISQNVDFLKSGFFELIEKIPASFSNLKFWN